MAAGIGEWPNNRAARSVAKRNKCNMSKPNDANPDGRDFSYLEDRLNDREPRVPQEETMDEENFLDNYPREAINDDIMDEEQIREVQNRTRAQARTNGRIDLED